MSPWRFWWACLFEGFWDNGPVLYIQAWPSLSIVKYGRPLWSQIMFIRNLLELLLRWRKWLRHRDSDDRQNPTDFRNVQVIREIGHPTHWMTINCNFRIITKMKDMQHESSIMKPYPWQIHVGRHCLDTQRHIGEFSTMAHFYNLLINLGHSTYWTCIIHFLFTIYPCIHFVSSFLISKAIF